MAEDMSEAAAVVSEDVPGPNRAAERALHARLLARDPVAPSELADLYLPPLAAWLLRRFPQVDPHLVEDAATDAALDTAQHPERYDPARLPLGSYLRMAARGDVLNALQKVRRRANGQTSLDAVERHGVARNVTTEGTHD